MLLLTERMKKSSTNTAPNGRIPEIIELHKLHNQGDRESHNNHNNVTPCNLNYLRKDWLKIPHLIWYLTRNLIGPHWVLIRLFSKSKVEAREYQRERNTKPQTEEGQHGGERDSSRWVFPPDEEVKEEPQPKHHTRVQRRRLGWKNNNTLGTKIKPRAHFVIKQGGKHAWVFYHSIKSPDQSNISVQISKVS